MYRIVENVPMEVIRYDDAPCYRREGFGGAPPWEWPMVEFFRIYLEGRQGHAEEAFAEWYRDQFSRYGHVSKRKGGFRGGSLFRRAVREHVRRTGRRPADVREIPDEVVRNAIEDLVARRWALLESLRREGYRYDGGTPPEGKAGRDGIYLWEGHHRTAALYALGYARLREVVVYPPWTRSLPPLKRALRRRAGRSLSSASSPPEPESPRRAEP